MYTAKEMKEKTKTRQEIYKGRVNNVVDQILNRVERAADFGHYEVEVDFFDFVNPTGHMSNRTFFNSCVTVLKNNGYLVRPPAKGNSDIIVSWKNA